MIDVLKPIWTQEFGDREMKEIEFAREYDIMFDHGTDGHHRLKLIAKMAQRLMWMESELGRVEINFERLKQEQQEALRALDRLIYKIEDTKHGN